MKQFEPFLKKSYAKAMNNQISSGWIGPGKTTELFEEEICKITGANYCLSTTSGTTAILIALSALEIPKTEEILFPAYTFLAGANAAKFLGYNVKLVDIKRETMSMQPMQGNVLFVNHNGYVGEDVGNPLIEDSSQALGVKNAGRRGKLGIFSFSVPKIVTTGQGGAVITDNKDLYDKCKRIRDHGDNWRKTRIHEFLGVNFRFNDILASFGLEQLKNIQFLLEKRKKLFDWYRKYIKLVDFGYESTWMVIHESQNPDKTLQILKENDIEAVRYYKPINHNPIYADNGYYSEAEYVYNHFLYLPSSLNLRKKDVEKVCKLITIVNE